MFLHRRPQLSPLLNERLIPFESQPQVPPSQVKSSGSSPNFEEQAAQLRSQAAGGVGVCASVAPLAFGCRLRWVNNKFRFRVIFLVPMSYWKAEGDVSPGFGAGVAGLGCVLPCGPGS